MTSAVQTSAMMEPPGGGYDMNNGSVTGSAASSVTGESGSTSGVPEVLSLAVLLPNGDSRFISVESGKQMMDLSVQLAAANKLSPASHTIQVVSESENSDRPIDYQPSQTLASIYAHNGPIALCLVHKRPDFQIEKMSRENSRMANQPFEKTQRLTVNLPQNQKTVLRVSPKSSMADILQLVCQEKNLDPASHALRHPSQPELDLPDNLTLKEHGTAEVSLVMINGGESRSSRASRSSVTTRSSVTVPPAQTRDVHLRVDSQHHHSDATMSNKQQHEDQPSGYYMPGMDNKKKKGFLSKIFSRKKGDSFKIPEATRQSAPPPSRHLSSSMGALNNTSSLSTPAPKQGSSDLRYSQPPPQRATIAGPPAKPPRKKRPAPPPPTAVKPVQPQTSEPNINGSPAEDGVMIQTQKSNVTHSRGSSHSSGFAEGDVSPLGSPASSSKQEVAGRSASDDGLGGSSDGLSVPPGLAAMHKDSLLTSSGSESGSLPRTTKKKRRAPLPPGAKAKVEAKDTDSQAQPVVAGTNQEDSQGGSTLDSSPNTLNQSQNDLANSDSQSEISRSRPCLFIAPPPPDTPPPTDNSDHPLAMPGNSTEQTNGTTVSDSSTQVHVSTRDSLSSDCGYTRSRSSSASSSTSECLDSLAQSTDGRSSPNRHALKDSDPGQKSDLAVFVDQMGELTENVYQESGEVDNTPPTEEDRRDLNEVVKVEVDENKHDVNHNVESAKSQDEPIDTENRVPGVTIKSRDDNSAVSIIRIGNPDSEFQDTLQAFDNVENDTDEGSALQSNTSVEEISLDGQNLEQEKGNFVSLIRVGDDPEEENTPTPNTATDRVRMEEATSEDLVRPITDEEPVHESDALLAMEEITFDQSEVVYVSPQNNEEESGVRKQLSDQEESSDSAEVVFFSEDGQTWGPTEQSEQPTTPSDATVEPNKIADVAETSTYVGQPSSTEGEDSVAVLEKGSEDPDLYTVTVTKEYVISHKPDESDYPSLPESARKSEDNEEAPRIKSLREAYRRSASGPQSSSRDDEDVWSPGVNANTLPDQTETFASESSAVNTSDTSNVTEPDVFVKPEEHVSLVTQEKSPVVQIQQQQQQRKNISVDAESPKRNKTSHREFTFLAPRPYGFRAKSEPSVKDVRAALQLHQASNEESSEQSTSQRNDARSPRAFSFERGQHRTLGLSKSDSTESPEHGTYFQKHGVVKTTRSTENVAQSKDKAKKSLQSQYADLQLQFARWQQQLKENQSLLDTKPIFETKDNVTVSGETKPVESSNKPPTATVSKEEHKPASRAPKSILKTSAKPERHPELVDAKPVSVQPASKAQKSAPVILTAKPPISPVGKSSAESRDPDPVFVDQNQDADHAVSKDLVTARSRLRSKAKEDKMCIRFNADGTKSRVYKSSVTDITAPTAGSPQIGRRSYFSKDSQRHQPSHQQAVRTVSASPPPAPSPPSNVAPVVRDNNNVPKSALRHTKGQSRIETGPSLDPREELMLAIRRAGGRGALRPVSIRLKERFHILVITKQLLKKLFGISSNTNFMHVDNMFLVGDCEGDTLVKAPDVMLPWQPRHGNLNPKFYTPFAIIITFVPVLTILMLL